MQKWCRDAQSSQMQNTNAADAKILSEENNCEGFTQNEDVLIINLRINPL